MKTTETITKKYQITKDLVVTVKSDPIAQDGMVETWKNTVTIKKVVEKLDPLSFKDGDAIAEFVGDRTRGRTSRRKRKDVCDTI